MIYEIYYLNFINMEIPSQNEIQFYQNKNVTVTQSRYIANCY
jgi:hypothetical protein